MALPLPSQEELLRMFSYDPETGRLAWKSISPKSYRVWIGREAGTVKDDKYIDVRIGSHGYKAHRIIWKMMTGHDPMLHIDHKDGDGTNNRWSNLREASRANNQANRKPNRNSKSGLKGVKFRPECPRKPWQAYISVNKKHITIGLFATAVEAAAARNAAAERLHGEFARAT